MRKSRDFLSLGLPTVYFYNICTEIGNVRQQLKYLILYDSLHENYHKGCAYFMNVPNVPTIGIIGCIVYFLV